MYIPFQNIPSDARIWIYQSDREINSVEEEILSGALATFCDQWMVHGQPMETSFEIRYNRFVILAANDQASGCSIDSSVRVMKETGSKIGVDFFNRNLVPFVESGRVHTINMRELKEAFAERKWNESSLTFNNLIDRKAELDKSWIIPSQSSWLKRFLPHQSVAG